MSRKPDLIVVGTGVSATLLVEALVAREAFASLQWIGPDKRRLPAQFLAYWTAEPTPFDALACGDWSTLSVFDADGHEHRRDLRRHRYRVFRTADWLESAQARLCAAPSLQRLPSTVTSVEAGGRRPAVHVDGDRLEADWIFVSGPVDRRDPTFFQRFAGWEVEVDTPIFEPRRCTLLDFRGDASGDCRFHYVLPLTQSRALVEHVSYAACDHDAALANYLRDILGCATWNILSREAGETPLYRDPPRRLDDRLIHLGVAGGLAKPSTGYALIRMWRDAEQLSASLVERGHPLSPVATSFWSRLADRAFLDLLAQSPARVAEVLSSLFAGADVDSVLAFLDERANLHDDLEVARAIPSWFRLEALESR